MTSGSAKLRERGLATCYAKQTVTESLTRRILLDNLLHAMSLPVTPTESMSRWTVIVRRDDGPTAEVDVDTSTTSTPLSSPLRRACAESLPDVALDQHHVIALPSPPAGASRRVVLTSNRDDLAMRSMLRCRTVRHLVIFLHWLILAASTRGCC